MLVNGDGGVGSLGGIGGGLRMVMRLERFGQYKAARHRAKLVRHTLIRGAESMVP